MADCPTFLINLAGSDDRLASSKAQFEDAGWSFERIDAVDGRGKPLSDFEVYDDAAALRYFGRSMTSGDLLSTVTGRGSMWTRSDGGGSRNSIEANQKRRSNQFGC